MSMDDITLFIRCFVNLFAIVNPLGAFPVFVATTSGLSPSVRFRVGTVCAGTVVFVLVIALLIGQFILNFFGISISSFRTAGGIFICLLSLSMLRGSMTEARKEGQATAALEEEGAIGQAIVPLAIPILAGPGAISSIIVYSSQITHFRQWFVIGGAILLFGSILWLMFCSAGAAVSFARLALECSHVYVSDGDRCAMQSLADLLRDALQDHLLAPQDLYTTESRLISVLTSSDHYRKRWEQFCSLSTVLCTDQPDDTRDWKVVPSKKRYIDPYVQNAGRVTSLNSEVASLIHQFLDRSLDYWIRGL